MVPTLLCEQGLPSLLKTQDQSGLETGASAVICLAGGGVSRMVAALIDA